MVEQKRVVVFGLGYVGCVTAACLAELGHIVAGVDKDDTKVSNILKGHAPFFEPGLEELVAANVAAGTLTATTDTGAALRDADIALICVGTPSERNGNLSLDQVRRVSEEIRVHRTVASKPLIITIRSTVFPGTCEDVVQPLFQGDKGVSIVSNPEFLREGAAVQDFKMPSLLVVGGADRTAVKTVADLYAPLNIEPCLVSLRTAEMIKYACNAFHAVKIGFANEIGSLSEAMGIDPHEVMSTLCRDTRLNISTAYLKPGFAFGGSCLPKDLRALNYRANRLDLDLPLLKSSLPSNDAHLKRAIQSVLELPVRNIGIFGLAFKENTDDLRESPVVTLLETLLGKGRTLRVYDPHIQLDSIYGGNRNFILEKIPHIGGLMEARMENLLEWAEHLVVAQKPSAEVAQKISASGLPVTDLVKTGYDWAGSATAVPAMKA